MFKISLPPFDATPREYLAFERRNWRQTQWLFIASIAVQFLVMGWNLAQQKWSMAGVNLILNILCVAMFRMVGLFRKMRLKDYYDAHPELYAKHS